MKVTTVFHNIHLQTMLNFLTQVVSHNIFKIYLLTPTCQFTIDP